jgi:uncharacterized protein involved in cysteine biosynthesis
MALVRGFLSPFRGALFVARHGLWSHFILPILINLVLAVVAAWLGVGFARERFGAQLDGLSPWLAWVLLPLLGLLVGLIVLIVVQPVVSAPFLDLLSEKVESIERGRVESVGLLRSAWLAVIHGLLKLSLYVLALAVAFGLGMLTGVGGALGVVLYAFFLAYDGFDYPLARRGLSFWGKWQYLLSHPAQTLGYCLGTGLLHLVPLMALLSPGFSAVGATLVYLESDRPERGTALPSVVAGEPKNR